MSKWLQAAQNARPSNDKTDVTDKTQSVGVSESGSNPSGCVSSVLSVLSRDSRDRNPSASGSSSQVASDEETYAVALRTHGPCGYGVVAQVLGWGATRAGQVEESLRLQGRLAYDRTGRGWLVERGGKSNQKEQPT